MTQTMGAGHAVYQPLDMGTTTDVPRPEYPRPQLVRRDWQNLNGAWEFEFDDQDVGIGGDWHHRPTLERTITVPFPYQSELSGIGDKTVHEIVWYARNFEVPPEWRFESLLLHFGAVDYRTTVWVNGREVGRNRGGHVPFSLDIAPYVRAGLNRLTLRVEDRQDVYQPRGKQSASRSGEPVRIYYHCTTGIWQSVWLEPVPAIRIECLRLSGSAHDGILTVQAFLHGPAGEWRLEVEVFAGLESETRVAYATQETTRAVIESKLAIPNPKSWSPETPHLYRLRVALYDGARLVDEVQSYAGLRTAEVRDGRFILNGEPRYLAMVLDQGYWPGSYLAAPSDEALRADVEWVKRFGFNGARKHQKIEDPRWLYWCDRLGLLVWEEMPNSVLWSLSSEEALLAEWERAIERDWNHPCIITWVPVNESMGFLRVRRHAGQRNFVERATKLTRLRDPNRPVVDNDGWEHTDLSDICTVHDYTHPPAKLVSRYRETLKGGPLPARSWYKERHPLYLDRAQHRGQPVVLSEVGGLLLIPEDLPAAERDRLYSFYDAYENTAELPERYRLLAEAIASLPFVAGFCYTQLTDVEQERNGLLTFDREPRVDPQQIAAIHRRLLPVP